MGEFHPVQIDRDFQPHCRPSPALPAEVTRRAFEVYTALYPGQSLERVNERAGFSLGEVIAFLYARSFPRDEWRKRSYEAMEKRP